MSIRERIERLRRDTDPETVSRREREQRFVESMAWARKELPILWDELKRFGVLTMIEEMTGERVPQPLTDVRRPSGEEIKKTLHSEEWSAEVENPQFPGGGWDRILQIVVILKNNPNKPRVTVCYNVARVLTIEGREVTFSESIPVDREVRVELLEEAFAEAFRDPRENNLEG